MNDHFKLLGFKVRDVITGFQGVAESICFDLYGCVQYAVKPSLDKAKPTEMPDGRWFDAKRLSAISKQPVMQVPTFIDVPGPGDKPAFSSPPAR